MKACYIITTALMKSVRNPECHEEHEKDVA
jgi:hypothetical protein